MINNISSEEYKIIYEESLMDINDLREEVENKDYFRNNKRDIQTFINKFTPLCEDLKINLTVNDIAFASNYNRIVIGGHGPYIEFNEKQLLFSPIMESGQEWRNQKQYQHCKYLWLTHPTLDVKIYKQKHEVVYADYKIGLYYVDLLFFVQDPR